MFKLVIQDDEGKTTVVPLIRDEITIGRKEGNTIRLTERNVSRRHARILRNNGEVQIEDLGSYNGIRVNNARIAERVSLRVSDQVQIGDYKLYLKAEGVEQVDDARTMPIERVDGTATDVMAVPPATGTPTVPLGIPQTPSPAAANGAASGLANAQLVGNPNRTLVAIADTDPAGRPVASAAQVAALQAPVGYGRLVVLSSNFAGKEFELSRPQMIVGRTDENDIVINHRSISRNHAKLVREPDTGRYTISDLQSSNGVRVNGQDYGKVELRRGDVVDLGHVRLRFVEAGEDFLFSRDAVITDVPETGGKKGLLVAILLGIIVLGGIGVYFAMFRGNDEKVVAGNGTGATNNTGNTGVNVADNGSNGSADNAVVDNGSDTVAIATPDAAVDNTTTNVDNGSNESLECAKLQADAKWQALMDCSVNVKDKTQATAFRNKATLEIKAEAAARNLEDAIKKGDYKTAKTQLGKIPEDSVSRSAAKAKYDEAWSLAADDYLARARSAADDKKCKDVDRIIREAEGKGVGDRARTVTCKAEVVATKPPDTTRPNPNTNTTTKPDPGNGSSGTTTVQKPDCDADALRAKGDDHLQTGMDAAALAAFEAAMRCKPDASLIQKAFMAACRSKNQGKAKLYFAKLPAAKQPTLSQICIRSGINPQ